MELKNMFMLDKNFLKSYMRGFIKVHKNKYFRNAWVSKSV